MMKNDGELVREKAVEAYRTAGGNWDKAADLFMSWIRKDAALKDAITEPLVRGAVWMAIRLVAHGERVHILNGSGSMLNGEGGRDGGKARGTLGEGAMKSMLTERATDDLMFYPLGQFEGLALGDATGAQVRAEAEWMSKQAAAIGWRAAWLKQIADRVPARKRVRNALSPSDLKEIMDIAVKRFRRATKRQLELPAPPS